MLSLWKSRRYTIIDIEEEEQTYNYVSKKFKIDT